MTNRMDLQPSAPYASGSSFPSPSQYPRGADPLLSLDKFHDFCQGGSSTPANGYPKFPFPTFSSSTKAGLGIDVTSEVIPSNTTAVSWGASAMSEKSRSSAGPYFSSNKIAYRDSSLGGIGSAPAVPLPSAPTLSSSFQGILHKCGIGSYSALDYPYKNRQADLSLRSAIPSSRITQKIRNLDEILRNLDHSMAKRFTRKCITEPLVNKNRWTDPEKSMVQDITIEQQKNSAEYSSGNLQGLTIPDGITHVNKAISRMEFRSQMEKLTGIIEDRWPDSRAMKTNTLTSNACSAGPSTAGYVQDQPETVEQLPNRSGAVNANTATSTNYLEEMLRSVAGLERRLAKQDRKKQSKDKGFLARGRLWIPRPASKMVAAVLQKQFMRHAASINHRLDKTDLAIKSLRRHKRDALSSLRMKDTYHRQRRQRKVSAGGRSRSRFQTGSLKRSRDVSRTASEESFGEVEEPDVAKKCMAACEALSRNMQQIQDQQSTLQSDSQHLGHSLEKIEKQSTEQSMEIELCWTAINHLCIDNETFREKLQLYQTTFQCQQPRPTSTFDEQLHGVNRAVDKVLQEMPKDMIKRETGEAGN